MTGGVGPDPDTRIGFDTGPVIMPLAFPHSRNASAIICELGSPDPVSETGTAPSSTSSSGVGREMDEPETVLAGPFARVRPGRGLGAVKVPGRATGAVLLTVGY